MVGVVYDCSPAILFDVILGFLTCEGEHMSRSSNLDPLMLLNLLLDFNFLKITWTLSP